MLPQDTSYIVLNLLKDVVGHIFARRQYGPPPLSLHLGAVYKSRNIVHESSQPLL